MKRLINCLLLLSIIFIGARAQITGLVTINKADIRLSERDGYDIIRLAGSDDVTRQVGAPELPVVVKTYVIPLDGKPTGVDATVGSSTALDGEYMPYPAQPPLPVGNADTAFVEPCDSIYNGADRYPAKRAEIVSDRIYMGYRLVTICLYPIEYDPVTKKIYLSDLSFNLTYQAGAVEVKRPLKQGSHRATIIKKAVKSMVDNPQDVDLYSGDAPVKTMSRDIGSIKPEIVKYIPNVINEQIPDYIIITNTELMSSFQRLADWKIQKGIPTFIKDLNEIKQEYTGSDLPEKIRAYLQDCWNRWGEGLFVLLGGDVNIVPSRVYDHVFVDRTKHVSDAYYSDFERTWNDDGNNLFLENLSEAKGNRHCFIGRAPVENKNEAKVFVDKVLAYEKLSVPAASRNYIMNHLVAAAYIGYSEDSDRYSEGGQASLDGKLSSFGQIKKWCLFDHYNCDCGKHYPKTTHYNNAGKQLTRNDFLSELDGKGMSGMGYHHIVYHMDHSSPRAMGTSSLYKRESISADDVDKLTNGNFPQIVISGGCSSAEFNNDCIAEHFLNNPSGGAVAFIGNSNVGFSGEYTQYENFLRSLYNEDIMNLGVLLDKIVDKTSDKKPFVRLHLLGDPEMPVWSDTPKTFDVNVTRWSAISNTYRFNVRINNLPEGEEALVCFKKDNECYYKMVISDNEFHTFAYSPKITGTMTITVTARNFIPYEKSFKIATDLVGDFSIAEIVNFNGKAKIGARTSLNIGIKNTSVQNAPYVVATLSSSSPYITVTKPEVEYTNIGSNEVGFGKSSFEILVSEDAPEVMRNEWNAACLYLSIANTDSINNMSKIFADTVKIDLVSANMRISTVKILSTTDGDNIPEPGEIVTMGLDRFSEHGILGFPKWSVTPISSDIENVSCPSFGVYKIKVSNSYKLGAPLNLKVLLKDVSIKQDSITVDIAKAVTSINDAKVHTSSTERTISFYWDKMGSESKYNIYRSTSPNGVYEKLNKMPLTTRYYEDADVGVRTPYYYKLSALTDDNLEGDLSRAYSGITTYPLMLQKVMRENYLGFHNEAYVADFDLDGKKELVQVATGEDEGKQYSTLYVVRPDGTEPYDIDGNVTTFSGYATFQYLVEAPPSVADLFGNGEPCIIVLPRDTAHNVVCYSSLDKDGDRLPDKLWETDVNGAAFRGAVVTDLDPSDSKGEKEIVFLEENGNGVIILDAQGNIQNVIGAGKYEYNYSSLAVADLDGDGKKEIVCSSQNAVFVWRHDGTPFLREPFFTRQGTDLRSSPIVCDLDNDGNKEILIAERKAADPDCIFAIRLNGTCLPGFDGSSTAAAIPYPMVNKGEGLDHAVTVGDINGDGKLEVASLGRGYVRAWNNSGQLILNRELPDLLMHKDWNTHMKQPLIADVDGDGEMDIVFGDMFTIYAIHADGTDVLGFPMSNVGEIRHSICISDIDADGKNEIIATDLYGYLNVWKTDGHGIEWGCPRFDNARTGEYVKGGSDPIVLAANASEADVAGNNDVVVRGGELSIAADGLDMTDGQKLIIMDGGTLKVDSGRISNANVLVKRGGHLAIENGGEIEVGKFGNLATEGGASVEVVDGEVTQSGETVR